MRVYARLLTSAGVIILTFAVGCESRPAGVPPELTIAVAANLTEAVTALGSQFQSQTGIKPLFSFGSTAELSQQIEQSAPFDVFLAADASHPEQLDREGLLAPGTRSNYAIGVLALWIPNVDAASKVKGAADLTSASVKTIAVAKPELAPYGAAAVEAMKAVKVWDRVQSKIVYANNINAAKQFGTAGNADAVFTAYSLLLKESEGVFPVDESLHAPIVQQGGVVAKSAHPAEARKFMDFLIRGPGREVLKRFGYRLPAL
jgi:molybdate transport system substrate-binding protein